MMRQAILSVGSNSSIVLGLERMGKVFPVQGFDIRTPSAYEYNIAFYSGLKLAT